MPQPLGASSGMEMYSSVTHEKNGGEGIRTLVGGKPPETVFEYAVRERHRLCLLRLSDFANAVGLAE